MRAPIKKSLKATNVGINRFIYNEKSKTTCPEVCISHTFMSHVTFMSQTHFHLCSKKKQH